MVKKKIDNWGIITGISLVLFIIFFFKSSNQKSSNQQSQFVEKEKSDTNLGSNLNTESTVNLQSSIPLTNLCSTITPYVFLFDLKNLCISNGGTWTCNHDDIGCYNLPSPLLDCSNGIVITALNQCYSNRGSEYCDSQNVYCKY